MHARGVIHRDLKPENILLDHKMRIKVTDFGTAKLLEHEFDQSGSILTTFPQDYRAKSFVGTAEYVAPELLAEKGQGKACDVWAFGCIMYQLMAGNPPFKASNEYQTFQKIIKLQYTYPPGFPSCGRDLIKNILVLDPNQRWPISRIKAHPFFEGVVWNRQAIWKQKHPRILPYRPNSRTTSNPISKIAGLPRHNNQTNYATSSTNLVRSNSAAPMSVNPRSASTSNILSAIPDGHPHNASSANQYNGTTNGYNSGKYKRISPPEVAASAAFAQPSSTISPYYSPPQQHSQPIPIPKPIQSQIREQQAYSASRQQAFQQQAQQPQQSRPLAVSQPNQNGFSSGPVSHKTSFEQAYATVSDINGGFGDNPNLVKPMELPPISSADSEFTTFLRGGSERVLQSGHIHMSTSNDVDDADKEPSLISRLFSNRKKKRTLIITTNGRLLVIYDNKVHVDLPVAHSQVAIKELPASKKSNGGMFCVETRAKVYTFEDPMGTSTWMTAISKAKEYVANAEAVAACKAQNRISSAALAAARRSTDFDKLKAQNSVKR